jgi:D-glycero-alpha-D-manno-heptose-7-phosphate kinase
MIISKTPLRISFVGGGTDLKVFYGVHGGAVVSTAIDKYIYVIVKKRFDRKIRVAYTKTEIVDSVDEIQHELVREALRLTGITQGIEIVTLADIPSEGTGLGSSSALTVGLLNAFHTYKGHAVGAYELAEQACRIEIEILNKPIGKQDQFIAALGGFRQIRFMADESTETELVRFNEGDKEKLQGNLMLFYTGITRSASAILGEQKSGSLANANHLLAMKEQCSELVEELESGNVDQLGEMLNRGWKLKKKLASGISTSELEGYYETAIQAGALGGKIAGAGGGGFLLLYVPAGAQQFVRNALPLQEMPFRFDQYGTRTVFNIE